MKVIRVTIEKSVDLYGAYAENVEGVWGVGENVAEVKKSVEDAIQLLKQYNKPENVPVPLRGEYRLVYKFDTQSLLNYYKGVFSNSALERITGINQRQLQHYSSGLKKPRPAQLKKIESGLHRLGAELLAIEL